MAEAPARWPRLLDRQDAAEYCGVSVNHFLTHVPVGPRLIGSKKLWDRKEIDAWLDGPASKTKFDFSELLEGL